MGSNATCTAKNMNTAIACYYNKSSFGVNDISGEMPNMKKGAGR